MCVLVAGEKPHKCKLCDKRYTQKSGLDVHMYSHTGQKPFECHVCQKQFVARTLWTKHLRVAHNQSEPPFRNMFGRGGFGGVNLLSPLPPTSVGSVQQPSAEQKTSLPSIYKIPQATPSAPQLPSSAADCLKILQESYFMNRHTQQQLMTSSPAGARDGLQDRSAEPAAAADDNAVTSTERAPVATQTNAKEAPKTDDAHYATSSTSNLMSPSHSFDHYFAGYKPKTTYVPGYLARHAADTHPMTPRPPDFRMPSADVDQRQFDSAAFAALRPNPAGTPSHQQLPYYG